MQSSAGIAAVRVALALSEAPGQGAPLLLRVGQQLIAEVLALDVQTGQAVLSMAGRRFSASTAAGSLPLQEGQVLRVVVADASLENLVLRVVPDQARSQAGPSTSAALDPAVVLAELELPPTPELRAAVVALMERGRPLTRSGLLSVRSAIAGQPAPTQSARAAVFLQDAQLPLTPRAVQLASEVLVEATAPPLGNLLRDLAAAGLPEAATLAAQAPTPDELQRVVTLTADPPEALVAGQAHQALPRALAPLDGEPRQIPADEPSLDEPAPPLPGTPLPGTPLPGTPRRAEVLPEVRADVPTDVPADVPAEAPNARIQLARAAGNADLPQAVRVLAQTLHDRIELQQLSNAAALARSETLRAPHQAAGALQQPNDVNELPAATTPPPATMVTLPAGVPLTFSIPLAFDGRYSSVDLTVEREGHGTHGQRDASATGTVLRVHFAVALPTLGEVSADVRLAGSTLRCLLTAPPGVAHEALAGATDDLLKRWTAAGFQVDALDCLPARQEAPVIPAATLRHVDLDA